MSSSPIPLSITLSYIQQQLTRYVHSLLFTFGVTGCCLNILLLSRRQFRTSSCCTYLLAVNAAMVIHLCFGPGMYLYMLDHVDPNTTVLAVCKLRVYILQSTSMIYRWCLTAACCDRYALSSFDGRLRNFAKIHIARRIIPGIILVWIVLPVHILIFYNLKGTVCGIVYSSIAALYHSIFTTITGGVLPIGIMMVCALLIHRNLVLKQQRRHQLSFSQDTSRNERNNPQSRRDRQVLIMLLIQVLIYGILVTPLLCWYFYAAITLNVSNKSPDRLATERFILFIIEMIAFVFPVSSFYLYTVTSQMFRAELVIVVRDILTCRWSDNTARIRPAMNGNETKATTRHLSRADPLPALYYSNEQQLRRTTENDEQRQNIEQNTTV